MPPLAGNHPGDRVTLLYSSLAFAHAVHFLLFSPFKTPVDGGERKTERWRSWRGGVKGAADAEWALHAIKDDKAAL